MYNHNEDFYAMIENDAVPEFDILVRLNMLDNNAEVFSSGCSYFVDINGVLLLFLQCSGMLI